jgi:hypothetical protein
MHNSLKIRLYKKKNSKLLKRYMILTYFFLGVSIVLLLALIQVVYNPFNSSLFAREDTLKRIAQKPLISEENVSDSIKASNSAFDTLSRNAFKDETPEKKDTSVNYSESSIVFSDSKMILHKVEEGQTLYSISNLYKVSPNDIATINSIENNIIFVDQYLRIPMK